MGLCFTQARKLFPSVKFGGKNSYSNTVKRITYVCGHEAERRDVNFQFKNVQIDETVFGKRKYERVKW